MDTILEIFNDKLQKEESNFYIPILENLQNKTILDLIFEGTERHNNQLLNDLNKNQGVARKV